MKGHIMKYITIILALAFSMSANAGNFEVGVGHSYHAHDSSASLGYVWNVGGTDYRLGVQYLGYIDLGSYAQFQLPLNMKNIASANVTNTGNSSSFEFYATTNPKLYSNGKFSTGIEVGLSAFKDKTIEEKLATAGIVGVYTEYGNYSLSLTTRSIYSVGYFFPSHPSAVKYNLSFRKKF